MDNTSSANIYLAQLQSLAAIVSDANQKIIAEEPDDFVYKNANFFTKSFLVIICAYIESYIKDILMHVIADVNAKLIVHRLPHNLIRWSFASKDHLDIKDSKYQALKIDINKKDLDRFISANPNLAVKLFKNFGIDLMADTIFRDQMEIINAIVLKRNKVVHHNDDASDLSNGDLLSYISLVEKYIKNLDDIVQVFLSD